MKQKIKFILALALAFYLGGLQSTLTSEYLMKEFACSGFGPAERILMGTGIPGIANLILR
jgi:hypothetical protein